MDSLTLKDPQKTPTIEQPFNKGKFIGIFGILSSPPAKPPGKTFDGAENIPGVVKALRDEANVI